METPAACWRDRRWLRPSDREYASQASPSRLCDELAALGPDGLALHRKRGQLSSLADKTKAKEDVLDELGSGVRIGEL